MRRNSFSVLLGSAVLANFSFKSDARLCADGYVGSCYNEGPWLAFYNNTCITTGGGFSCPKTDTMSVYDNKVYAQSHATSCNGTVGVWPKDDTVQGWAAAMLQPFPMAVEL